jgi:DNA-binding transcriptional regulator LsrR (DeoR family)
MDKEDKLSLLAEVASMYYEQDLTQAEIAKRTFTSRSRISRLLTLAKEKGIVEIKIHYPTDRVRHVESALKEKFGLKKAMVLKGGDRTYQEIVEGVGALAANYLDQIVCDDMIVGISWGKAVYNTVKALKPEGHHKIQVVQIMGTAGTEDPVIDAPELIRTLANKYNGNFHTLYAPLYVEDDYVRNSLMNENTIRETLKLARKSDIILTGIGCFEPNVPNNLWEGYTLNNLWEGYLSKKERKILKDKGIAGTVSAHFYDVNGKILNEVMNNKIIGLDLDEIDKVDTIIGVAGGFFKAEAILGAIRGKFINVLVTDEATALKVLAMADEL